MSPLATTWWTQCVAQTIICCGMTAAIVLADWAKISEAVQEYNNAENDETDSTGPGQAMDPTATMVWASLDSR